MNDNPRDSTDEISRLRERLFLAPQDTSTMAELAAVLEQAGDLPGAIDVLQRLLRADPYDLPTILALGRLWRLLGDRPRARSWYERALQIDPDSEEAAAGLTTEEADGLTPAYIRTLFDQYADRFDAELTGTLGYRAPALVAAMLRQCAVPPASADILDLGCGTGLSGLALRPFAAVLDGVDLSPAMVAKAEARGIYDALAVAEALAFLEQADRGWGMIAAVDVLNYVGALAPLFRAAGARLARGGLLVGTVELRREGGVELTDKRRYTHGADHLAASVGAAGLDLVEVTEAALRTEARVDVPGLIFAARKRA